MKNILDKLGLPTKFLILGIFALVLFILPTYLFIQSGNEAINVKTQELQGVPIEKDILTLLNLIQRHRAESAIAISQNKLDNAPRVALASQIDAMYEKIASELRQYDASAQPTQRFLNVQTAWSQLQQDVLTGKLTLSSSLTHHAQLIQNLLDTNQDILDLYSLSLDADLNTYQLIMSIYGRLPELTETLGRIRASGTSIIAAGDKADESYRGAMEYQLEGGRNALEKFSNVLNKAFTVEPGLKTDFAAQAQDAYQRSASVLKMAENVFITKTVQITPLDYVKAFTQAINAYNDLGTKLSQQLATTLNDQIDQRRHSQYILLAALLVLALIAVFVAFMISRSVTRPVKEAVAVASKVAAGDLTTVITVSGNNEIAELLNALAQMQLRLSLLVTSIKNNASTIANSSEEIAMGNNDLSSRTEEQAASLAETAASMEQLSSIIKQNADNTRYASDMAVSATNAALMSGDAMNAVMATMQKIRGSSSQIEEITAVIDSIAFQTNILALNAAVEAARAGELGKGFAVVAAEVRALAQRSAGAAKEIKGLIEQSVVQSNEGLTLAQDAGSKVKQSVEAIEQTSQLIRDISSSSEEQSSGVSQINIAVNQMDQVTQQNAVLVEQSASSADELAKRASDLRDMVSVFRTA
ncbi:methyl-accepting chemotaxis protein [Pantoea stewartii subsp. indologenes]|uniref:methyl-accepting chemotaxis protein n=1 Tax=Pantoea stewartii TaxID=66269 RepID=UPI00197DBFA2|nr:methyl-accepting chemotaxis protein [Pantoea stewartii]MDK2633480.1 methyl-accepting chemotaxis protein [Pantoea stewartii subsp. indologenes]